MRKPYVVGELRPCADCGAMFPRGVHRCSYCPTCDNKRRHAHNDRANERKRQERACKAALRKQRVGHYKLPPLHWPTAKKPLTEKKKLPFCAVCRVYNGNCGHQQVIYG